MTDYSDQYVEDSPPEMPGYGPARKLRVHFNDFVRFCQHRRLLAVTVHGDRGFYDVSFRNPVPEPPGLMPDPEQLERDEPRSKGRKQPGLFDEAKA